MVVGQHSQRLVNVQKAHGHEVQPSAGVDSTQLPLMQRSRAPQALVQLPQWFTSLERSGQLAPHPMPGAGQVAVQLPFTQLWPDAQGAPQPPQFAPSIFVSRQMVPQWVRPGWQMHALASQVSVGLQVVLHPPQWAESRVVSKQPPLHEVAPAGQPQAPASQVELVGQLRHWAPQWRASVSRLQHLLSWQALVVSPVQAATH